MLRGPQTPGELKQRAARLHDFSGLPQVQEALERMVEAGHVERHPRRPGQKEDRYEQVLGGQGAEVETEEAPPPAPRSEASAPEPDEKRLDALERQLQELRAQVAELRAALGD